MKKTSRKLMRNILLVVIILLMMVIGRAWFVGSYSTASGDDQPFLAQISIRQLLEAINNGKNIVLIDAREKYEFDEEHIPGAINIVLRDIPHANLKKLKSADMVVAYCMKDFRGFEMGKSLHLNGLSNVYLLKPSGLAGWKALGLPTQRAGKTSSKKAKQQLLKCSRNAKKCMARKK